MSRTLRSSRLAFWALAFALVLKAAVPLLAAWAADWQGRALVEVCTVYGVRTIAVDGEGRALKVPQDGLQTRDGASHDDGPQHDPVTALHGEAHCVLTSVLAQAPMGEAGFQLPAGPAHTQPPATAPPPPAPALDAAARWAARLHHAPPPLA